MNAKRFLWLALVLLLAGALEAQQARVEPAKAKRPEKAAVAPAAPANPAPAQVRVDGDQAYKANCSRCHLAARKFSQRKTATIMRHMRVRANLTEEETRAILEYLTR